MKKFKYVPLVAMISAGILGCGGGSSGGGGGGGGGGGVVQPTTTYTFTFVTPVRQDLSENENCTIFDNYQENSVDKVLNYHSVGTSLDSIILGFYSNADGTQQGDLIRAKNGKLALVLQTIPDDGFFTIQEADSKTGIINAISFSKAALELDNSMKSAYLSVQSIVNNSTCLTGNNDVTRTIDALSFLNPENATGTADPNYYFDSQIETVTGTNPTLTSTKTLEALSAEKTMIAKYRTSQRSQLYQYGFEGWNENMMKFAGEQSTPSFGTSLIDFSDIEIFANYNSHQYLLATVNRGDDYYHPTETNGDTWSFKVNGTTGTAGWDATYFDTISSTWELIVDDNSLFMLSNTNNAKPSVSGQTIDISSGIGLSNEVGLQRLSYKQGTTIGTTNYLLRHTLYTLVSPSVRVPNLNYDSVPSAAAAGLVISSESNISQDYLLTEKQDDLSLKGFMSGFGNGKGLDTSEDVMGIAANLKEVRSEYSTISTTRSLLLSRDD